MGVVERDSGSSECSSFQVIRSTVMQKPLAGRQEKNWIPIPIDDHYPKVYSIYCFDPWTVLECHLETGETKAFARGSSSFDGPCFSNQRGSSNIIPYQEGYLLITHQLCFGFGPRKYFHRFLYFDLDLETMETTFRKVSHPFYFLEKSVEFCAGLTWSLDQESLLITFGFQDKEAHLVSLPKKTLDAILVDIS
jgi:hypothetical protein